MGNRHVGRAALRERGDRQAVRGRTRGSIREASTCE